MAIDRDDHLYIVDMTARIQVFTTDGRVPAQMADARPRGGQADGTGDRPRRQHPGGRHALLPRAGLFARGQAAGDAGGQRGEKPGEFGFVTSVVQDREGNFYVSEYGDYDRIQKFTPDGRFIRQWGGQGSAPGQFRRPQKLVFDEDQNLWVADACNHRIQVFSREGKLLRYWGKQGSAQGELYYPYDLAMGLKDTIYVCEMGNSRVQRVHPRRPLAGLLGVRGTRPGGTVQSLGVGPRQPRHDSRVGYEQSPGPVVPDGVRDRGLPP